jgi:hypothetical protein
MPKINLIDDLESSRRDFLIGGEASMAAVPVRAVRRESSA